MFQKIDWLDRNLDPGVVTVVVSILLLVILAGAIYLTIRKGFAAGLWLFLVFVICAGTFALRYLPLKVDTASNLVSEKLPLLIDAEVDGLPLIPENEIDQDFLSNLGRILGEAKYRRILYPEASSGAGYQIVRLIVQIRNAWSTGEDGANTLVAYDLTIYAGFGEGDETYDAEDVKGTLTLYFGDGSEATVRLLDGADVLAHMWKSGMLEVRDSYVDAEELAMLEKACGYERYQVNSAGQTFGTMEMHDILWERKEQEITEEFKKENPDLYQEILATIQKELDNGIIEEHDWGLDKGVSWITNDEGIVEELRLTLTGKEAIELYPDLVNFEYYSAICGEPVKGYLMREDYIAFLENDPTVPPLGYVTTYSNDGKTVVQQVILRDR